MALRKVIAVSLIALVILLSACSSIERGTITSKVAEPGMYMTQQSCAGYNKQGVCTVWVPITTYDDPDWRFDIRNENQTGWVYVTEETFNQYEVGDFFG